MRYVRSIAPAGGSGSLASPYSSITAALRSVSNSSRLILCVSAGQYTESLNLGTNRRIVLVGGFAGNFATRSPATTPSVLRPTGAAQDVITAQSPYGLTIDGFEITGSQRRGINVTLWDNASESVVLLNNHVHHNGSTANPGNSAGTGGINIGGGARPSVVVSNNVIEANRGWHHGAGLNIGGGAQNINPITRDGNSNDGYGAIATVANGLAKVSYNIIRNNELYETWLPHGAGAAVAMNAIVDHNEFSGNATVGNGAYYGVGGGLIAQHGSSNDRSLALVRVENNWFENNRAGKAGSAVFLDQTHAGYVINNVIVNNIGPGAILVDGACSNRCAGINGNHDRNFVTVVNNTVAGNQGAGLAVQDSTAHLYYNVFWNNSAVDDVLLLEGSPGAANIVRGSGNVINSVNPGLSNTIVARNVPNVLGSDFRLVREVINNARASTAERSFVPALVFPGSLFVNQVNDKDFQSRNRWQNGRILFGAYADTVQ